MLCCIAAIVFSASFSIFFAGMSGQISFRAARMRFSSFHAPASLGAASFDENP